MLHPMSIAENHAIPKLVMLRRDVVEPLRVNEIDAKGVGPSPAKESVHVVFGMDQHSRPRMNEKRIGLFFNH